MNKRNEEGIGSLIGDICRRTPCSECKIGESCGKGMSNKATYEEIVKSPSKTQWVISLLKKDGFYERYKHLFRTGVTFR